MIWSAHVPFHTLHTPNLRCNIIRSTPLFRRRRHSVYVWERDVYLVSIRGRWEKTFQPKTRKFMAFRQCHTYVYELQFHFASGAFRFSFSFYWKDEANVPKETEEKKIIIFGWIASSSSIEWKLAWKRKTISVASCHTAEPQTNSNETQKRKKKKKSSSFGS